MRTTPAFPLVVLRVLLGGAIPDLGLVSAAPLTFSPGSSSLPKPSPMRSRDWHTFEAKRLDDGVLQQPTTATTTTNGVLAQRPRALSDPNVPAALGRSEPPMSVLHARANDAQTVNVPCAGRNLSCENASCVAATTRESRAVRFRLRLVGCLRVEARAKLLHFDLISFTTLRSFRL